MGISGMGRNSDSCYCSNPYNKVPVDTLPGNPNPRRYEILDSLQIRNYLIIEIRYPDCKNYEGRKIMVYHGINVEALTLQEQIDPHFSDSKDFKSPIARFEPTDKGWRMAETFVKAMVKNGN